MLAFARRQELRPETVDVAEPGRQHGRDAAAARSGPAIQIVTDFEPDLPPTRVDPNQLELALLNLALNARDAMPLGGQADDLGACASGSAAGDVPGLAPGEYVCIADQRHRRAAWTRRR